MLVVMACTMAIAAPITIVVGVILALRQDVGLSVILVVAMPVAAIVLGIDRRQMVPAFRLMQERIDSINRVLREQITGIRVVRAFVREPEETERFEEANDELTATVAPRRPADVVDVPHRQPAHQRVERGRAVARAPTASTPATSQVGSLVAYLSYLVQILMSVVMATFTVSMVPRASVAGEPHPGGARHRSRRWCRRPTRSATLPAPRHARAARRRLPLPRRRAAGAQRHLVHHARRAARPPSSAAPAPARPPSSSLVPRLFDATAGAVLVDGVDVRELDPESLWNRIGLVPQRPVPVLRHRRQQPPVRQARRHRGRDVGGPRGRPGGRLRAGHAGRARGPHRAGRHQRLRRPAPAALDRPGARAQARDLRVRRLVLGPRPRHRRPAADGAAAVHAGAGRRHRRPAGVDDRHRRRDPRARGRRARRPRHPRRAARDAARPTPRSCSRRSASGRRAA